MLSSVELELVERELSLVKMYRENPVLAAEDLLRVKLPVPQQRILEDMWFKNFVLVTAGRGTGKTFLQSVFACLWALLYPGQKIGLLAPSFRQAKTMFAEVDRRWSQAPLLQEASANRPIRASDRCYLTFKSVDFKVGSVIEAVPLGDGSKIRGARYYVILADEFAQIPENIFNTVILPMGATVADPMENVERLARQRTLIESGHATEDDFKRKVENKVIMTSSAFYQFNHMYSKKLAYEELMRQGDDSYATHTVSFRDMPEGFLSEANIKTARAENSQIAFRMEYEGIWEADSAGVFKASLIEKCRQKAEHSVLTRGRPGEEYFLGVDPARASDAFALTLIEAGSPYKLVAAWEYYQNQFPQMAQTIMDIADNYNVVGIQMDAGAGGGGLALKDLLAEEERWGADSRILDCEDDEYETTKGRKILHMFNPGPKTNAAAVNATLSLMEQGNLTLPKRPQLDGVLATDVSDLDAKERLYETIEELLRQAMLIEVSETRSGIAHFDVPTGGGHAAQKKDLFSSFILASKLAYDIYFGEENEEGEILEIGIIENKQEYKHIPKDSLADRMQVSNTPIKSWEYRKGFKPG